MKSNKDLRIKGNGYDSEDLIKKSVKLTPNKKSGKERHSLYSNIDEDDDDTQIYKKRESVLDYYDDDQEEAE